MSKGVKIVTDSASDLPVNDPNISVVPLKIRFDTEEFTDGYELSREEFWNRMATASELPATSAPSPGAFEETFRKAATEGFSAVVCLTISSAISATYQIARTAADSVAGTIPVHVVDSQACALAQSTLCNEALQLANDGADAEKIVAHIDQIKTKVHLYATLDTLENLKKGGRIGAAGAFFGSLLSVKPIVGLVNGEVKAVAKARTRTKAIDHLIDLLKDKGELKHVTVGHTFAPDVDEFVQRVSAATGISDIPVTIVGPVVGTHTGPRLLAISFMQS